MVAVASVTAALFYPALRLSRWSRLGVLVAFSFVILISPLIIPPERSFPRWILAVLAVMLTVKLTDLHIGAALGYRPGIGGFLLFLPNPLTLVFRKVDQEPRPARRADLARLPKITLMALPGTVLFAGTFFVDWRPIPFAIEHSVKVVAFFLALVPVAGFASSIIRLLGMKARNHGQPIRLLHTGRFLEAIQPPCAAVFP